MKNKKMMVAVGCTALAVILLICVIAWRAGGDKPVDPTDGTTQGTAGSSGDETTESTALESGLGESYFPEDTQIPTDTWPDDVIPPNNEPTKPSTEGTDPATDPSGESTTPSNEPSAPVTEPSAPVTEPSEPVTEPTDPTEPATDPTEPATDSTEPPTEPPTEPTEPEVTKPPVTWEEVDETVYATDKVNVRKGPSTDYDKMGQLKKGESVKRTAIGSNGWSRIEYEGQEAYVSSGYLTTEKPSDETEPTEKAETVTLITMYANQDTEYRTGPGEEYPVAEKMKKGTAVAVIPNSQTDNGFTKIRNGGEYYWIPTAHLSENRPGEETEPTKDPDDPWSRYVGPADPETGISWDGVSPIIYTYEDGTTGTELREGENLYEERPGMYAIYLVITKDPYDDPLYYDGVWHCEYCGKVCGQGENGTCIRWSCQPGEHTCPTCGAVVPEYTCHTCDEE